MQTTLVTVFGILIGFLAGLLSFRVKQRWCPICGETLTCPDSARHGTTDRSGSNDPTLLRRANAAGHRQAHRAPDTRGR